MTSASPRWMNRSASPIAWAPAAQAEVAHLLTLQTVVGREDQREAAHAGPDGHADARVPRRGIELRVTGGLQGRREGEVDERIRPDDVPAWQVVFRIEPDHFGGNLHG
jgi:hypothetical protein